MMLFVGLLPNAHIPPPMETISTVCVSLYLWYMCFFTNVTLPASVLLRVSIRFFHAFHAFLLPVTCGQQWLPSARMCVSL